MVKIDCSRPINMKLDFCKGKKDNSSIIVKTGVFDDSSGKQIVYASKKIFLAFKKIEYGRKMGLPPIETHKELKEDGLGGSEMRAGLSLFEANKGGKVLITPIRPAWLTDRAIETVRTGIDPFTGI